LASTLHLKTGDGHFETIDPSGLAYHDAAGCKSFKFVVRGLFTLVVSIFQNAHAVSFISKFTSSDQFDRVFKEGMSLVEETANYLDGPGRVDTRSLDRLGAIAYATESMRLTTRLMQLASWLLLQRAIASGELSYEEADREKHRINLSDIGRGEKIEGSDGIPKDLLGLIDRSMRLLDRVQVLDTMIAQANSNEAPAVASPVSEQLDRLARAFGGR
jgi:regulator of CtrA degradation